MGFFSPVGCKQLYVIINIISEGVFPLTKNHATHLSVLFE